MKAREFLAQAVPGFTERELVKSPLNEQELKSLAKRAGGIRELVKPLNQKDIEGMADDQVLAYLVKTPNSVRRPIIDIDGELHLGFRADTQKAVKARLSSAK